MGDRVRMSQKPNVTSPKNGRARSSRARWVGSALGAAFLGASLVVAPQARATVIERIVAVVGEHAILLSDVRQRGRPFLLQIHQRIANASQEAAAESEMFKQLLDRMVDERLEQQAAEKAHLTVSSEEIDNGLHNVAVAAGPHRRSAHRPRRRRPGSPSKSTATKFAGRSSKASCCSCA